MFDDFFERGGNCFDTAHIYMGGKSEKLTGQWIRNRGLREQTVIIDKGAHTPFCTPKDLVNQFNVSLERLGVAREITGKRRGRIYVYDQYVRILDEGTAPL